MNAASFPSSFRFLTLVFFAGALTLAACGGAQAAPLMQPVESSAILQRIEAGDPPLIVDVRGAGEFRQGRVPGAINIPHGEMATRANEIEELLGDKERPVVLYCQSGRRAGLAARELRKQGFTDIHHITGDMPGWIRDGHPVEKN